VKYVNKLNFGGPSQNFPLPSFNPASRFPHVSSDPLRLFVPSPIRRMHILDMCFRENNTKPFTSRPRSCSPPSTVGRSSYPRRPSYSRTTTNPPAPTPIHTRSRTLRYARRRDHREYFVPICIWILYARNGTSRPNHANRRGVMEDDGDL
jgi:hypothetical protein